MSERSDLIRAGWVIEVINDKEWFIDPESGKKYRSFHATVVQDERDHAKQVERAGQAIRDVTMQVEFYRDFDAFDHNVDEVWPKVTKAHGRSATCCYEYGCIHHIKLMRCDKGHFHHVRLNYQSNKCPTKEKQHAE